MSLLSRCLGTGEDVALVLRDIGVLLVERRRVQMRFYHNFLEAVSGKENLEKGVFKIQELLDMVVPQGVPVAALISFGSIIVFPECVQGPSWGSEMGPEKGPTQFQDSLDLEGLEFCPGRV
ncbi:hypothetical protein DUI87_19489 [Hirundo rustica rustica]|uniref:CCDC81 HU domain-containing protein n=1 Tax=Hirundo rustica rustica TaxID=333673 RepID=A0A3M0JVD9_HIRRU|nr:hypothetical protein DUI87_19489 [Hirundo rustica rustica]